MMTSLKDLMTSTRQEMEVINHEVSAIATTAAAARMATGKANLILWSKWRSLRLTDLLLSHYTTEYSLHCFPNILPRRSQTRTTKFGMISEHNHNMSAITQNVARIQALLGILAYIHTVWVKPPPMWFSDMFFPNSWEFITGTYNRCVGLKLI